MYGGRRVAITAGVAATAAPNYAVTAIALAILVISAIAFLCVRSSVRREDG
jgi:glycerol-3-phosphate acyltransferase PlsY